MGGEASTFRHSTSNAELKMCKPTRGRYNFSSPSRGSTVTVFVELDCLKAEKKRRQRNHMNLSSEKVVTAVKKMIMEEQDQEEMQQMSGIMAVKKITPTEQKQKMQEDLEEMTLEDWIRGSPRPKPESLTSSGELCVFKALSRKAHPSFPRSETCGGVRDENEGRMAKAEDRQNSKTKRSSREISGGFGSTCEYF